MMLAPTTLNLDRCHVMGIVNITPDSFYGASRNMSYDSVVSAVRRAVKGGATIVDIGGYSSRPGADDISIDEEWHRVKMGLDAVAAIDESVVVSVDTFRSDIVRRAVAEYGDVIVNDISAGEIDREMIPAVAELGLIYVAMHMRGVPQTMQQLTDYRGGVVHNVVEYFRERVAYLEGCGITRDHIILDPGFGFAKSVEQNMTLLAHLAELCALGCRVLAGVSRKSMIYRPLNITPDEALPGSLAFGWEALRQGATILRVHDVEPTCQIVELYNRFIESV